MEDLFNILSSATRIDKSKRRKKPATAVGRTAGDARSAKAEDPSRGRDDEDDGVADGAAADASSVDSDDGARADAAKSKRKRPKKQHSAEKLAQMHREEISAFRRRIGIRLSGDNRQEAALGSIPDPISSFKEWRRPEWWGGNNESGNGGEAAESFNRILRTILNNIENGKWTEPTPIQMQTVPSLMERRDVMGCAPTGSGKTGAFVLPALALAKCGEGIYYGNTAEEDQKGRKKKKKTKKKRDQAKGDDRGDNLMGQVRAVLLAPSRELASQLHREVLRLSSNMPGKFHTILLSKSNAGLAAANKLGGKAGIDCLVATPMRLVTCLENGMKLGCVRLVVLDEADRLLDASDGSNRGGKNDRKKRKNRGDDSEDGGEQGEGETTQQQSGSSQSRTFLQQIDSILAELPASATRALFSATLGPFVRHLSESILRSPVDITTGALAGVGGNSAAGGASEHIRQELKFVGREEGKLLAMRQLIAEGIRPPILVFLQSKERAQALFGELLYDGVRVDVVHAGRSHAAREESVRRFRRGETWVLICTDLVARGVDFKAVNLVINYDLPGEGVTYVHRIGRTGRAGRPGRAITFFTEADFDNLRMIANVMRLSGCAVPGWMLKMKRTTARKDHQLVPPKRTNIYSTPGYNRKNKKAKRNKGPS